MERNVNGEEHAKTNDCNLLVNSPEFLNSITDTNLCNPFTIRAYVAEIQRRDWKICWPFYSVGNNSEISDFTLVPDCSAMDSVEKICEEKESDSKSSPNAISFGCPQVIDMDSIEKSVSYLPNVGRGLSNDDENKKSLNKTLENEKLESTICKMRNPPCLNEETPDNDGGKFKETGNASFVGGGVDELGRSRYANSNVDELNVGRKKSACVISSVVEVCRNDNLNYGASCTTQPGTLKSKDEDDSKNTNPINGVNHPNKFDNSNRNLKRRNPQKFRLLSEILGMAPQEASRGFSGSSGIAEFNIVKKRANLSEVEEESDDLTLDSLFKHRKIVQTNSGNASTRKKKKKNSIQVQESEFSQMQQSRSESEVPVNFSSAWVNDALNMKSDSGIETFPRNLAKNASVEMGFSSAFAFVEGKSSDRRSSVSMKKGSRKGSSAGSVKGAPANDQIIWKDVKMASYPSDSVYETEVRDISINQKGTSKMQEECLNSHNCISETCDHSNSENLDDIPMEIVKLLAENRRERRLLEIETAKNMSSESFKSKVSDQNAFESNEKCKKVETAGANAEQVSDREFCIRCGRWYGKMAKHCCPPDTEPKTGGFQKFSATPQQQKGNLCTKYAERQCACVQKKIGPRQHGSESMTAMQLLRLVENGMTSQALLSVNLGKEGTAEKSPARLKLFGDKNVGKPAVGSNCTAYWAIGLGKKKVETKYKTKKTGPPKGCWGPEICVVNRNPSDFSYPGTGNRFMRRSFKSTLQKWKRGLMPSGHRAAPLRTRVYTV